MKRGLKTLLFIVTVSIIELMGSECGVDDRIMYGIASVESHKKRPVGYPYLISINSKNEQKRLRKIPSLKKLFLDTRTIDCKNQEMCVIVLDEINKLGITNLDLGSFQINQMYWEMPKKEYFSIKGSYEKACEIVLFHNRKEWNWKNIAKFHSGTKKYNERYQKYLLASINKGL